MGLFSSQSKRRDKEFSMDQGSLNDPEALAFYYMDTLLCHEHYMKHEDCTRQYQAKWFFTPGRRKLHRECVDYLDKYKACLIGINVDKLASAGRSSVTADQMHKKR